MYSKWEEEPQARFNIGINLYIIEYPFSIMLLNKNYLDMLDIVGFRKRFCLWYEIKGTIVPFFSYPNTIQLPKMTFCTATSRIFLAKTKQE